MEAGVQRAPEYGELVAEEHVPGMEVCTAVQVVVHRTEHVCVSIYLQLVDIPSEHEEYGSGTDGKFMIALHLLY